MPNKLLTAVIPLRLSPLVFEAFERLILIVETIPAELIDILIIDYGSETEEVSRLAQISKKYANVQTYHHKNAVNIAFSIGHARDLGAEYAKTAAILFHDIDFICTTNMYHRIHAEIINREITSSKTNDFFCVPVAFLNEQGNSTFKNSFNIDSDLCVDNQLQSLIINNSKKYCQSVVYGSSAIVVNRYHYLSIGGHHRDFSGHGAEDYDILHRLSYYNPKAPRTSDYYDNLSDSPLAKYKGFRTYFALHGMDVFMKGIFMLHLYHPPRRIANYHQSRQNFPLLKRVMAKFDLNKLQPMPLRDRSNTKKTLILSKQQSSFTDALRYALPAMGDVFFIDETLFSSSYDLISYLKTNHFTHIGFKNPYGNTHRLGLYKAIQTNNIHYWVFDRGALPDSWFFDPNGFNADSSSYHRDNWDKSLDREAQKKVRQYIDNLCLSSDTLEHNGERKSTDSLRKQLNIGNRKVIFIPFQRPTDSVCKYFAGNAKSAQGFNDIILELIDKLDTKEWVLIGKKHPLEDMTPKLSNMIFVDDNTHIHDLLSLADCVVVLNSGVGLLASLFNTPTIYLGDAFYGHKGINHPAKNATEILALLKQDIAPDQMIVERFTYHLIEHVYSFGKSSYTEIIRKEDGGKLNLVNDILFENVRGLSKKPIIIGARIPEFDLDETLFFSFGGRKSIAGTHNTKSNVLATFTTKQRWIIRIFSFIAHPMLTSNQKTKLNKDPERFFRDANNGLSRWVARQLNIH